MRRQLGGPWCPPQRVVPAERDVPDLRERGGDMSTRSAADRYEGRFVILGLACIATLVVTLLAGQSDAGPWYFYWVMQPLIFAVLVQLAAALIYGVYGLCRGWL